MPEGPSLVIAREQLLPFIGQPIMGVEGNASAPIDLLLSNHIVDLHTWGKVLLIDTENVVARIHFLMFGSHSIYEQTKPSSRLRLKIQTPIGSIFFYTCSARVLPPEELLNYDWEADVLDDSWNADKAKKKLKSEPDALVCDALLDQQIFSGVGNIIKNEVLYRIRVHPETLVKNLPARSLNRLIAEARNYSFDFLKWKREYVLKKHWLVHTKKTCPRCNNSITKKYCGITKRRTFFCDQCQVLY